MNPSKKSLKTFKNLQNQEKIRKKTDARKTVLNRLKRDSLIDVLSDILHKNKFYRYKGETNEKHVERAIVFVSTPWLKDYIEQAKKTKKFRDEINEK